MHAWQAELARVKLVEVLSGYRDRDQVLAQVPLEPAYTPSPRHRRLGREMQMLLMHSVQDSWIETHQWVDRRWIPPARYDARKLARQLKLTAEAVDRAVDESPASGLTVEAISKFIDEGLAARDRRAQPETSAGRPPADARIEQWVDSTRRPESGSSAVEGN